MVVVGPRVQTVRTGAVASMRVTEVRSLLRAVSFELFSKSRMNICFNGT
jgi:hypothetical protein